MSWILEGPSGNEFMEAQSLSINILQLFFYSDKIKTKIGVKGHVRVGNKMGKYWWIPADPTSNYFLRTSSVYEPNLQHKPAGSIFSLYISVHFQSKIVLFQTPYDLLFSVEHKRKCWQNDSLSH